MNDKRSQEEASLKDKLAKEKASAKYKEELDELRRKTELKYKKSMEKEVLAVGKLEAETKEQLKIVQENIKKGDHGNIHVASVASMLMDAAPRLEALVRFVAGKARNKMGEGARYVRDLSGLGGPWHGTHKLIHDLKSRFATKEPLDIPDLKYYTNMNEDGVLEQAWASDNIKDLFNDDLTGERKAAFDQEIEDAVIEWIDTLDDGYFISTDKKMYLKSEGDQDPHSQEWTPKPEATCVAPDQFYALRDNTIDPEKSLAAFLEHHFAGVVMEPTVTRPSM